MPAATRVSDKASGAFVGSYTGTTAAQNIYIGFKPCYIRAWNLTDGDTEYQWTKNSLTVVLSVVALAASSAAVITGIEDSTGIGFALPASNAIVNLNTKVYHFIAFPE